MIETRELGRRSLLVMLAAYAGLTVVVVAASWGHALLAGPERAVVGEWVASAELTALLGGISPGTAVGRWIVKEVGMRGGTVRVELQTASERVALTLARAGVAGAAGPVPLASTRALALYPAVHDLSTYRPTAAVQEAATVLAMVLAERAAPPDLQPLR